MRVTSRKYRISFLVLLALIDITFSSKNDTSRTPIERRRQSRVSGRIVKLYSGPKPDPILCVGEGFQADAADCSIFYRCLKASNGKYTVYRFQCGPGTIYDPETEICNHPWSTKRSECRGLGNEKLISSTTTYNDNEIDELQEGNQELPSPISTISPVVTNDAMSTMMSWRPDKLHSSYITTSYPWFTTASTSAQSNTPDSIHNKTSTHFTTSRESSYSTRKPSSLNGDQCTSDGFMGDSVDCRKFYRCVNNQRGGYVRYEFSCSENTIWDDDTQGCNHPWAVQRRRCGKGNTYDENNVSYVNQISSNELNKKLIQQQTQISYGSKVTQSQTQISNGPVIQNQTQINFGDRINRDKDDIKQNQTQISNGSAVSQSQTQISFGNKVTQTQVQIDHSSQSSQTQTQIAQFSSTSRTTTSTQHMIEKDSSKCSKDGFMGDSNDCKKFYRCTSNGKGGFERQEFSCSEGTLWDKKVETCNHAWAVKDCGVNDYNQNMPPMDITHDYHTITYSSFNNEIEDEVGYGNQNNAQDLDQLNKSPSIPTISTQTSMTTETLKLHEKDCNSNGFFGNVNDCARFYRCVENGEGRFMKYEYKCGDGTVWDPEIESCNHAWMVKQCGNGLQKQTTSLPTTTESKIITTVSLIQTTTQKNVNEIDYDSGYGSVQSAIPPQSTTTERISYQGNECKTGGFIRDNNDCKKFYRCVEDSNGSYTRFDFTCGEGTVWDPEIGACNHASAVKKCGGSVMKENDINKITTTRPQSEYSPEGDNSYTTHSYTEEGPESSVYSTVRTTTVRSISTVSNNGNECQTNGFMGDSNDCRIFYRCVENGNGGFTRYEFSCGDGTVWDSRIAACNHVWAVEKCGGSTIANEGDHSSTKGSSPTTTSVVSESTTISSTHYTTLSSSTILTSTQSDMNNECVVNGYMGDKNDCKKFYRCVDDGNRSFTRFEFTCGEGTVWDSNIEACNHAWAVKSCGNALPSTEISSTSNSIVEKDEETDNNNLIETQSTQGSSTESISWSTSTIKSSTVVTDSKHCNTEGFMGDNDDCKKFYRCVNDGNGSFTKYEFTCSEGNVWDSEINACNHMSSVKTPCSSVSTQTTIEQRQNNTSSPASISTDYSTTSKPQKPQQCEKEGFIGDNNDCKKFYRCTDNGQGGFHKYEFTCGEGTMWDQEILACNHASSNRNCSSSSSEYQAESSDTSTQQSTLTSISVTQSTEKAATSPTNDECVSEGFYANLNDCKKFYRCVGDGKGGFTKYDFTCGDGTIWVQEIQACDHDIDNSHCSKNTINTSSQPDKEGPTTTTSTSTFSSTSTETSTPAKGHDEEMGPSSTNKPVLSNNCQSEGFYPNTNDCKQFYQCVNDGNGGYNKYEYTCSEGTAWDVNTQSCNYISEVNSCQNQAITPAKPTIQDESISDTSSTTEAYSTGSTTTKASNRDTCEESGYFGNSEDCKKFYRCVDNGKGGFTKYDYDCGDGTIWDQDITACNHPQDVSNPSCNNKESKPTTTTTTTTTTDSNQSSESTTKQSPSTDSSTQSTTSENNISQSTQETPTKKPTNTNYTCTEAGFYADPNDCKKFYRCVDWGGDGKTFSIYHFDCGEGTIWDPALQTCNHEDSVYPPRDCSGTQSQTENNGTTTTRGTTSKQEETTQSTTQESTTQSSTTTESSSTQQSSTTDQTSSTEQSTTQQSTTEKSTTQKSTTEQSTTQQSTTEQSTTQQSTTEQSTTQQSTSEQSTTQQSTTEQSTTQQSTTEQSTTQQSTTEQSTTEQSTTEQSTTQKSTTEESTTQQSTTEQTTSTTTEQTTTTTSSEEITTTTAQTTTSGSTTSTAEQTTKAEQTTQESTTGQSSSTSTTEQSSTTQEQTDGTSTTESGQDSTTEKESSNKECPETDDDQYLYVCPTGFKRHPKYCNLFYQCTEDDDSHDVKVAVFNCPNNTIYDESKIQCVEEGKADKKCDGQIAQKRRVKRLDANYKEPITVNRENYSCQTTGHFPFERNEECSPVLFKCETTKTGKIRGLVYQCPEGYVYWAISRKCESITTMTDCKRSSMNWNIRHEIPIERKNVARKK